MEETKRRRFIIRAVLEGEVDVSEEPVPPVPQYVTSGLIHRWDAIDNTRSGHNAEAAAWEDLVGSSDLTLNNSTYATWGNDYIEFTGNNAQYLDCAGGQINKTVPCTVEVVFQTTSTTAQKVIFIGEPQRSINLYSDNTVSMQGTSSHTFDTGLQAMTDIRSISAVYGVEVNTGSLFVNSAQVSQGSRTHSLQDNLFNQIRVAVTSSSTPGYYFVGKIHAIRIYDRQLTAADIAQNYAADQARFGF